MDDVDFISENKPGIELSLRCIFITPEEGIKRWDIKTFFDSF